MMTTRCERTYLLVKKDKTSSYVVVERYGVKGQNNKPEGLGACQLPAHDTHLSHHNVAP